MEDCSMNDSLGLPCGNISILMNYGGPIPLKGVLIQYVQPLIYFVGIFANVALAYIICDSKLGKHASMVYVCGMTLTDTGYLLFQVVTWLQFYFNIRTYHVVGMCQLTNYSVKAFTFLARWYLTGFALERFIWELHPERRAEFCNVFRTKLLLIALAVVAMFGHVYLCWFSEVSIDTNFLCTVHHANIEAFNLMLRIDMVLAFLTPTFATLTFVIFTTSRKVRSLRNKCTVREYDDSFLRKRYRSQIIDNRDNRDRHLHATGILISFTVSLIILTIPSDMVTFLGVMFSVLPLSPKRVHHLNVMADIYFILKPFLCVLISPETRNRTRRTIREPCNRSTKASSCPNTNIIEMDECPSSSLTASLSDLHTASNPNQ